MASCTEKRPGPCRRAPSSHALPSTCIQDKILDGVGWAHKRTIPCSFYKPIVEWAERAPTPCGGYWYRPIVPIMGYAAPPLARCA